MRILITHITITDTVAAEVQTYCPIISPQVYVYSTITRDSNFAGSATRNTLGGQRAYTVVSGICPGYTAYYRVDTYHQVEFVDGSVGVGWTWTGATETC